jgi:predicted secreted hydrolase
MWKLITLGVLAIIVVVFGFSLIDSTGAGGGSVEANAVVADSSANASEFARAIDPYDWQFPRDHGPHPEFQTEWWYYTGNLADANGRRFGYQFTVFRRTIMPHENNTASEWRTNQVYLAHFTVTDVQAGQFHQNERLSRGGADLAGATIDPRYHVWLEGWDVQAQNDDATQLTLKAESGDAAVNFTLEQAKPPTLQGDHGLSAKSEEPGNASYYYSLTRLLTDGTVTISGEPFTVSGTTWMDHEFSTSALGSTALGWDWFGLQLDDNRELMLGYIRLTDGGKLSYGASLVQPDGSVESLSLDEFTIEPTGTWTSPHTGGVYPAGWNIHVQPEGGEPLDITLTPLIADQELQVQVGAYWEGAVAITGDMTGHGYAELTGYVGAMTGKF